MQFNLTSFIFSIVNFIALVLLLQRFLYGPIRRAMDARAARIRDAEDRARQAAEAAEAEREEYRRRNESLAAALEARLAEARAEAAKERARLLAAAEEEADRRRAELAEALRREKEAFIADAAGRMAVGGCEIARRILGELADEELEGRIVRRFLAGLAALPPEDREAWIRAAGGGSIEVRTAFPLPESARQAIAEGLRRLAPSGGEPAFIEDASIVCGIVVACGGRRLGWSIDGEVDRLRATIEEELDAFAALGAPVEGADPDAR